MSEFKIGSLVNFKGRPSPQAFIVAFYSSGAYVTEPSDFVVIASAVHPLTGPNLVFHHSLIEQAVPVIPGAYGI